ncbi:hypothetical protein Clacol_005576 [Clathrus columnatus]|uniref:Uncharacterized protein n=1 Tax=Clathrus columnatus TaxID=1419009 RepID=A0AAV5ADT0_9AGAM|nr:hypothetical protein Clacol_005576 [Clathrus columnatus]
MFFDRDPYNQDDIIDREFHPNHLLPSPSPTYSSEGKTEYDTPYPIPKDSDFIPPNLYPTRPSYHPFQTELRLYIDLREEFDIKISPMSTWPDPTPTKTYHKELEDLEMIETLHYGKPITTLTNSSSSSSYTSQFCYQPPFDSDTDDQAPTPRSSTPISPTIEDLKQNSSSKLSIDPDTLWPQYPLMSQDVSARSKVSNLGLPETIKYGDTITMKSFEGRYHINHYFTITRCTPPHQVIQIIATASLGFVFEHIGFDVPYEYVLPYSSLPYHAHYVFIPFEELLLTPPCLYPEDYFYSIFPAPTPLPTPPINKMLRKIRSYAIGVLKGRNQSLAEEKCLEEGLRKFQNHLNKEQVLPIPLKCANNMLSDFEYPHHTITSSPMSNSLMSQQFNNRDPTYFLTEVRSYYSSEQSLPFDYTLNWPDYPGQVFPVATIRLLPKEPFYLGQRLWFTGFREAHKVQRFISVYQGTQQEMVVRVWVTSNNQYNFHHYLFDIPCEFVHPYYLLQLLYPHGVGSNERTQLTPHLLEPLYLNFLSHTPSSSSEST